LDAKASAVEDVLAPIRSALRAAPVFAGVGGPALEALAVAAASETFEPGTVVVRQGRPADDLYVVVEGSFDVTSSGGRASRPTFVRALGPGDVFGEIGLLQARPRTATVTATTAATVYRVPGRDFLRAVEGGGQAFAALCGLAGDRLMRTHGAPAVVSG
jgi:CRP-like cAMP-binding protein